MSVKKSVVVPERHYIDRVGWLRAAVLGANDGIVSISSLIVGVTAAQSSSHNILIAGIAGLVAGAMSMAAGEYVSVSSHADTEKADLAREKTELRSNIEYEREELASIYVKRGLSKDLAKQVSEQLMRHDALAAHARDELGISEAISARPIQAAFASACAFSVGGSLPLLMILITPVHNLIMSVSVASLIFLALLGTISAHTGGASKLKAALRVTFWGALAMILTAAIGALFGTVV